MSSHPIFSTAVGMASLVEYDFAVNQAGLSNNSAIAEHLDCEVQDLDLEDNIAEIWKKFDTPPLSPEHESSSCSSSCVSPNPSVDGDRCYNSEDQISDDPLLGQLLECERLLALDEEESLSSDSPSSQNDLHFDLLLRGRDCMWNSTSYEPRNLYTPAPSPPPAVEEEKDMAVDAASTPPSTACINPAAVFPALLPSEPCGGSCSTGKQLKAGRAKGVKQSVAEKPHKGKGRLFRRYASERDGRGPAGNARIQPQAVPSESEEEIDVVTVVERPATRTNTRKRLLSMSAPCSRQTSPVPSPVKKRKYHTKRLQRFDSVGASSLDGGESDDEQRRACHNILERKRRNDLKYSFQVLRGQIPDLEDNQRAPKVTILRRAADFIRHMQMEEERQELELSHERSRTERLMERLAYLKSIKTC